MMAKEPVRVTGTVVDDTTDTTVTVTPPDPLEFPPIVYIGLGIAMLEMGRIMFERGLEMSKGANRARALVSSHLSR